ncbi:hypothetical protein ACSBR1_026866 [Camellia fascicularis]
MKMAKQVVVCVLGVLGLALTCKAAFYTVGDSSGWDISTDLDTWVKGKTFAVGDVLLFQYSSIHSVNEVTKNNYQRCNTTNVLQSSSNGNTTFPLSTPGDRYYVCGDKLHCLGGMKLHINVAGNQAPSPANAPESATTSLPTTPSSKSDNPTTVTSSGSTMLVHGGMGSLVLSFMGLVTSTMFWVF